MKRRVEAQQRVFLSAAVHKNECPSITCGTQVM
jgi:hypothetical protein